ncbi:MAG: hypothetical protein ACPKPY_00505 [Nitrososphaeraceae archaeon]
MSLLLIGTSQYVYAQRDSMKATAPESEDSIDSIITAAPGEDNQVLSGSDILTAMPGDEESTCVSGNGVQTCVCEEECLAGKTSCGCITIQSDPVEPTG